jgi:SOS-response transcriptional repressor LexA
VPIKRDPSKRAAAFKAWMAARNTNTKQVAERAGVAYTTLASFIQGSTQSLKGDTEAAITRVYGATAAEIFGGAESNVRLVPVVSWVAAGKMTEPDSQPPPESETIEISGLEPGDYFGTRVRGDSMNRLAPEGALIIVNRAEREPIRGRRYIFSHRGKTTFKRFGGQDPLRLEPESLNQDHEPIYPKAGETWEVIGRVRLVISEL